MGAGHSGDIENKVVDQQDKKVTNLKILSRPNQTPQCRLVHETYHP